MKVNNNDFVHLHCHSEFSAFDGYSRLNKLVDNERSSGRKAVAITDHGVCGAVPNFLKLSLQKKNKKGELLKTEPIKPIIGIEFYMSKSRHNHDSISQPNAQKGNHHICILAKNWEGYKNLCTLSNIANREGFYYKPRIDLETIQKYKDGLIFLSGCPQSLINSNLIRDNYSNAKKLCGFFKDLVGTEDFYIESQYHGLDLERKIIPDQFKLAKELGIKMVATNDAHYLHKEDAKTHDVFLCMSMNKCIADPNRNSFSYSEFYMKSAQEMYNIFGDTPELLYNTVEIANSIDSDEISRNLFGKNRLPRFEIPKEYKTPHEYISVLAWEGMKRKKWDKSPKHIEALKKELYDINIAWENNNLDFASYFLIVKEYIDWARANDISTGAGRGSGYASILLHCLSICTGQIDPLKSKLIWERFPGFSNSRFIKEDDFFSVKEKAFDIDEIQVNDEVDEYDEIDDMEGVEI